MTATACEIIASVYDRSAIATDTEIAEAAALLEGMRKAELEEVARQMGFEVLTRCRLSAKAMAARIVEIIRDRRGIAQRNEY